MQITIFGASRGIGRIAVDVALARGHAVTAVARTPVASSDPRLTAIAGDVRDPSVVSRALTATDAVLVALGTSPFVPRDGGLRQICSAGTHVILDELGRTATSRIVVVSSYGVGPTRAMRPFPFNIIAATLLREVIDDKEIQERDVRASRFDWTIVQPLGLTDKPATGMPFVSADGKRASSYVTRADVANVCIDAIASRRYVHESIAIS